MSLSRRNFLRALLLGAGYILAPSSIFAKTNPALDRYPFALGIASGSPSADGFILWTRLLDQGLREAVEVRWEVFEEGRPASIVAKGRALAQPELAYSVHAEVAGLRPDRWYGYRFMAGDAVSPTGRTRTFPAPDAAVDRLRFAYASCQRWDDGYYAAYRHMAAENLDGVLFLGDYIYENSSRKNAVRGHKLRVPVSLNDYRQRYELYKSDPDLQRMHAACPWLVTWDDHEVQDNYAGQYSIKDDGDFLAQRTAAYQAYYEHMPLRASALVHGIAGLGRPDALRIYDRFSFGRLATFHLLDDRQYRDLPLCQDKPLRHCTPNDSLERTLLGAAQERWLDAGLKKSAERATSWNIIGSQTIFTRCDAKPGPGVRLSNDSWNGYPGAQKRLIDSLIKSKARNPVIVGGDIHQNWVANVHRDLDDVGSPVIASEFCGTSISSNVGLTQHQAEKIARENPHCLFANSERRGYGVVEMTPKKCEVSLRALHDVRRQDSDIETLAAFTVADGNPGIRRLQ